MRLKAINWLATADALNVEGNDPVEQVNQIVRAQQCRPLNSSEWRYLTGAVVLHPGGWEVPVWVKPHHIWGARLAHILHQPDSDQCCDLDLVLYLMTASLVTPLPTNETSLYIRTAAGVLSDVFGSAHELSEIASDLPMHDRYIEADLRRRIRRRIGKSGQISHSCCTVRCGITAAVSTRDS